MCEVRSRSRARLGWIGGRGRSRNLRPPRQLRNFYRGDLSALIGQHWAVSDDPSDERRGLLARFGVRTYLILLIVVAVLIGVRLVSKWLKWLLIGVAVSAVVYLIMSARSKADSRD